MECPDLIGQLLDGKYQLTRELGRGGMGAVYLATHLGTERPVAVKVIAPQFMERAEFIERFRREARAAGRLRHPNVVNVTDFGFAEMSAGQVAYLVMEYLDGCTLGEILEEEKNLPVSWTLDILEQVSSAVHEAHQQGIIHRDLKPDNIWLEPNQRGGYTVKVLDFGIAKLEEHEAESGGNGLISGERLAVPTYFSNAQTTLGGDEPGTLAGAVAGDTQIPAGAATVAASAEAGKTIASEAGTVLLPPVGDEGATAIYDSGEVSLADQDTIGTQVIGDVPQTDRSMNSGRITPQSLYGSNSSSELTRVGAVLGTPLYMSPEQCRGEHLDPRSDVYSLGVIAYQMLSGRTPFQGDFKDVMEAHKSVEPMPLPSKRVRRKMKVAIHMALEKDPDKRPQTAEAFASELLARHEGIFGLLRRSMTIYTEHLPKFVMLAAFFSIPMAVLTVAVLVLSYLKVSEVISDVTGGVLVGLVGLALSLVSPFCASMILGTIAWIVTQYIAIPLRPVRLRPALAEARRKWKRFAGASLLTAFLPFLVAGVLGIAGFLVFGGLGLLIKLVTGASGVAPIMAFVGAGIAGVIGFFIAYISYILVAPVVMMENRKIIDSLRRSRALIRRSFWTSFGAVCILIFIPVIIAGSISYVVSVSAMAYDTELREVMEQSPGPPKGDGIRGDANGTAQDDQGQNPPGEEGRPAPRERRNLNIGWMLGRRGIALKGSGREMDMQTKVKYTALESVNQLLWLPAQILVFSFSAIIIALLYMKTRLAGGEGLQELIERFEDDGRPKKKWQERVRQRLIQSGRIPSKP